MGTVVIVTGTPGTGKTSFSMGLAREIGADYTPLTEYVSMHKLYSEFDRERKSKIIDVTKTRRALTGLFSRATKPAVLDSHIPDRIVPKEMVKQVFVLRCHPRVLEARLRTKKWKPSKIRENVLAEVLDSCLVAAVKYYGSRRVDQLDTSRTSVRQCIVSAKRILVHPTRKRKIRVDWIATLEKERLLDRYLK